MKRSTIIVVVLVIIVISGIIVGYLVLKDFLTLYKDPDRDGIPTEEENG